jgi:peptidoglycan hydrolase-like protein with peptidoglycan-binding domain
VKPSESFIGQPVRSLQTMLRAIAQQGSYQTTVIPDGIYGPETTLAVTDFQKRNRLPPTGVTDFDTWTAISDAYDEAIIYLDQAENLEIILDSNQVIRIGERNPFLYVAQGMLLFLSDEYDEIIAPTVSGSLDGSTARSIASFQKLNNITETGELDKKTWKHLTKQYTLSANRRKLNYL